MGSTSARSEYRDRGQGQAPGDLTGFVTSSGGVLYAESEVAR